MKAKKGIKATIGKKRGRHSDDTFTGAWAKGFRTHLCNRSIGLKEVRANAALLARGKKYMEDETKPSHADMKELFGLFRGTAEFTDATKHVEVNDARQVYDWFYDTHVKGNATAAAAFDPSYVVLDDPLPAALGTAIAAYPVGNPHAAPIAQNGSGRMFRCANEAAAQHLLGYLLNNFGATVHGWVAVCARAAIRVN